jgi:hypothetical protein
VRIVPEVELCMSCELAVLLVPPYVPPDPEVVELDEVSLSGVVLGVIVLGEVVVEDGLDSG